MMGIAGLRGIHRSAARHHQHRGKRALRSEVVARVLAPAAPKQHVLRAINMVAIAIPVAAVVLGTGDGAVENCDPRGGLGVEPEARDVVCSDVTGPTIAHALEVHRRALWS